MITLHMTTMKGELMRPRKLSVLVLLFLCVASTVVPTVGQTRDERHSRDLMIATSVADIRRAKRQGKVAALMGIEGGHAIEDSLPALREFYRLGIRYMTLTWNNTNNWADAGRGEKKHGGLNDFGREVVREMNRLGMLVDVSHVSDETIRDALEVSTAPIIASHSSARALSNVPRNIPDDLLKRIAKNGGVVQVNFYSVFVDTK